ncbi:MAG: hypothetical protein PHV74_14635 [Dehalococcoidia bacterium]|nr:hypothetical protein [Dehalococcoidia bacterium]
MRDLKSGLWYKILALILVMTLIVPLLAACGDDDDDKTIPAEITTPASSTASTTPTITVSDKPVKIGVVADWSGPAAVIGFLADGIIAFTEWYWNEKQGGVVVLTACIWLISVPGPIIGLR